jgi:uncharacterized protein (DUF2267 family)
MANRPYDAQYEPRPQESARDEARRYESFLGALARAGPGPRDRAERIAVGVLCPLERRLSGGEARDLNFELPWAMRDLLRSCALDPRASPERWGADEFLARVAEDLELDPADVERTVRIVLSTVRSLLSEKEASDVLAQLPPDLQALWAPPA